MVSKKLIKSAAGRNRKRRQIYEIIRNLEKENRVPCKIPCDTVLIARKAVPHASFLELENALTQLLTATS